MLDMHNRKLPLQVPETHPILLYTFITSNHFYKALTKTTVFADCKL